MAGVNIEVIRKVAKIETLTKSVPIHEYQAGVIYAYKDLQKLITQKNILFFKNGDFCIKDDYFCTQQKTKEEIQQLLKVKNVNAISFYPELKPVKRCEVTYRLSEVFSRESYENRKKYYKLVRRGFNIFEREGFSVRELTRNDIAQAKNLHKRWIDYKLENYRLYRIMFPEKRYERCLLASFDEEMQRRIHTVGVFNGGGRILGFRTIYVNGTNAYDLAYITNRECEITDFSEFFEITTLGFFRDKYSIEYFNCGLSEGDLKRFKKHLPNREIMYYRYKKIEK